MRKVDYIDDDVESVNRWEERRQRATVQAPCSNRIQIGRVEQFFSRLNVAAIKLTGSLKVGDIIEIGTEEEAIRQRVSSMQIDKEDVSEAGEGEDIGIKLKYKVPEGSDVYRIG